MPVILSSIDEEVDSISVVSFVQPETLVYTTLCQPATEKNTISGHEKATSADWSRPLCSLF